jgi:zinc protease
VYQKYIKGKHFVATSFVPKGGQFNFRGFNSSRSCGRKKIIEGKVRFDASTLWLTYEKNTFKFDRSVEPAYGESPDVKLPTVWKKQVVIQSKRIRN